MGKIAIKLLILLFPFYILCPVLIKLFPMKFMDKEYAVFYQNKEVSLGQSGGADIRVLIMGDSVAKCSWIPKELSDDSYNFSLYGTCPMEEYYYLREYLSNHSAPQVLIYSQQITHMINAEAFWSRSVYFHRMSKDDLRDLEREIRIYDENPIFEGEILKRKMFDIRRILRLSTARSFLGLLSGKCCQKNRLV